VSSVMWYPFPVSERLDTGTTRFVRENFACMMMVFERGWAEQKTGVVFQTLYPYRRKNHAHLCHRLKIKLRIEHYSSNPHRVRQTICTDCPKIFWGRIAPADPAKQIPLNRINGLTPTNYLGS